MLNVKANKKFSMNLTVEDAKKIKSTKEKWCCDYKGCNAALEICLTRIPISY